MSSHIVRCYGWIGHTIITLVKSITRNSYPLKYQSTRNSRRSWCLIRNQYDCTTNIYISAPFPVPAVARKCLHSGLLSDVDDVIFMIFQLNSTFSFLSCLLPCPVSDVADVNFVFFQLTSFLIRAWQPPCPVSELDIGGTWTAIP